jgi:hypothetical protein
MANRASLASVFPDLTRSPIRNCHFQNPGASDLVSVYALVIHGNLPLHGITGVESQSSMVHVLTNNICRAPAPRKSTRFNPARAAKFRDGPVAACKKHCAAQAEYTRLAAQAYSPSDAMSQARFCLGGMKKGSTPFQTNLPGDLRAETGPCGGRTCSRGRGGPPDFPRHRRPRCIAPCGGVVRLRVGDRGPAWGRDFPP